MRKSAALFLLALPLLAAPLPAQSAPTAPLPLHTHNNLAFRREPIPATQQAPDPAPLTQGERTAPIQDCLTFDPAPDDAPMQRLQAYPSLAVASPEFVLQFPTEGATHPAPCGTKP